jgi:hypothetical protein
MNNIIINKEGDFKDETISSIPFGINNFITDNNEINFDLKKNDINNIKPMLYTNSNIISIPDGKRVKIKPLLNKKVPVNTFSMMANPKKNLSGINTDEINDSSDNSLSESDDILSNNSKNISLNNYNNNNENESYEENGDEDDYSSIESNLNKKISNKNQSYEDNQYEDNEDEDNEDEDEDEDEDEKDEKPKKQKSYEEVQKEKQKLLFNLERLQKQGYPPSKKYSMASSFEDMQFEHDRLKKQRDVEKSIKFSRKILMAVISGIEFLNGRFDPLDAKLEGWSENIMENVTDYDEVFEELHEKYSDSIKMAPELKIVAMVAGSGFMFHLTNSLFKSASPKLSDILKQNPDIMKNISEAAVKNMGDTINQEFGQDDVIGNMMKSGMNMKMNQQRQTSNQMFPRNIEQKLSQSKMSGPIGVDELLNELNSEKLYKNKDDSSVSSNGSINIKSSSKRTKSGKKGGIQLDIR